MSRSYSILVKLDSFMARFNYLKLEGTVGADTFGHERYLNQMLYHTAEWQEARRKVIIRDNGCDLGLEGYDIFDKVFIHHLNPITKEDILQKHPCLFDPDNLVCVSHKTHNAIHYGDASLLSSELIVRSRNDTCPWKH